MSLYFIFSVKQPICLLFLVLASFGVATLFKVAGKVFVPKEICTHKASSHYVNCLDTAATSWYLRTVLLSTVQYRSKFSGNKTQPHFSCICPVIVFSFGRADPLQLWLNIWWYACIFVLSLYQIFFTSVFWGFIFADDMCRFSYIAVVVSHSAYSKRESISVLTPRVSWRGSVVVEQLMKLLHNRAALVLPKEISLSVISLPFLLLIFHKLSLLLKMTQKAHFDLFRHSGMRASCLDTLN